MSKAKYLLLVILIAFLVIPKPAFAFIGTGIFDYFEAALGGIEEFAAPVIKWVTQFLFIYFISLFTLATSGSLLQYIIGQQGSLGFSTPGSMGFNFVQAGWQITSSLANMALLLIFLAIAFAWILKIESFAAQKALPRLILAALLINFSLLFVGILVDISNVFYNAFLDMGGGDNIVSESINRVFGGLSGTLTSIITLLVARAVLSMIVFTAPFVQLAFVVTLSFALLPQMVFWIFQILIGFMLSSIFLLYFLLFAFRMFVIWILAVLAPLAFVCLVLPQTKKHWDEWLKHLLEWILLGIFALFFLILGLKTVGFVAPAKAPIPFFSYGAIPGWFIYYFFLFIYFCVALWLAKRATPQIATFIMEQGKTWGGRAVGLGMPYLRAIGKQARGLATESERLQGWAQRMSTWQGPQSRFGRAAAETFMLPQAWRATGRAIGPGAVEAERRDVDDTEKKVAGKSVGVQLSAFRSAGTNTARIGILNAMIKDKNIDRAISAGLDESEIRRLYPIAQNRYNKHSTIRSAFPHIAAANLPQGVTPPTGVTNLHHILGQIKAPDYENVSERALNNNDFIDAVLERGMGGQISALVGTHQRAAAVRLEERLRVLTGGSLGIPPARVTARQMGQYLQNRNPRLGRYFSRGAGAGLIGL